MKLSTEEKVCLALSILGVAPSKALKAFNLCGGAAELSFGCTQNNKQLEILIGTQNLAKWSYAFSDNFITNVVEKLEKQEVQFVTFKSANYPLKLKDISEPPLVLYCKGNLELLHSKGVSVIGTRKNTNYGERIVAKLIAPLIESSLTIISGLAMGIDTLAHTKTLEEGGNTIAVLGAGFNNLYPPENLSLSQRIARCGLLISEYPPDAAIKSYNFPRRNRIVSALSEAVVIVEAHLKSGVFSTVEHASEQGVDVYAFPGDIFSFASKGCNYLITRSLAKPITEAADLLEELHINYKTKKVKQQPMQLSMEEQAVVSVLEKGTMHLNQILDETQIKISTLNFVLSSMELKGLIVKQSGNIFKLTN